MDERLFASEVHSFVSSALASEAERSEGREVRRLVGGYAECATPPPPRPPVPGPTLPSQFACFSRTPPIRAPYGAVEFCAADGEHASGASLGTSFYYGSLPALLRALSSGTFKPQAACARLGARVLRALEAALKQTAHAAARWVLRGSQSRVCKWGSEPNCFYRGWRRDLP